MIIKLLLQHGADPHAILEDGTPLINAVMKEGGLWKAFLPDMNLDACDAQGMTPFLTACATHQPIGALTEMIAAGADVRRTDKSGKSALHWAISAPGYKESPSTILDVLLSHGLSVDRLDDAQMSPLHYAIQRQACEAIHRLLDAGADATIPFPESKTSPLHILLPEAGPAGYKSSRHQNFVTLVQRLIKAGVDKEFRDCDGKTPIFGYVAHQPSYDDEYFEYNEYPDLDEQRRVLGSYDIHARNNAGETLLHVAAKRGRGGGRLTRQEDARDMFKNLWDMGLDPKTEDNSQRTPLDVAAACRNTLILDLFAPKP